MLFIQALVIARSVSDEAIQKPSVRYQATGLLRTAMTVVPWKQNVIERLPSLPFALFSVGGDRQTQGRHEQGLRTDGRTGQRCAVRFRWPWSRQRRGRWRPGLFHLYQ